MGGTSKGAVHPLFPIGRSLSAETVSHSPGQDPHDSVVIHHSERRREVTETERTLPQSLQEERNEKVKKETKKLNHL